MTRKPRNKVATTATAPATVTHEDYIRAIMNVALESPDATDADRENIRQIKLVYGTGRPGTRGTTYFNRWKRAGHEDAPVSLVEICAFGQESPVQICGTTLHELGHVCAGIGHGHDKGWKDACARLGLIDVLAAGTDYTWDNFDPVVRRALQALPTPTDGLPCQFTDIVFKRSGGCTMGFGSKGGTSRGKGSGSRLRLYECECTPPIKIRAARDNLSCTCNECHGLFSLSGKDKPDPHTTIGGSDEP